MMVTAKEQGNDMETNQAEQHHRIEIAPIEGEEYDGIGERKDNRCPEGHTRHEVMDCCGQFEGANDFGHRYPRIRPIPR